MAGMFTFLQVWGGLKNRLKTLKKKFLNKAAKKLTTVYWLVSWMKLINSYHPQRLTLKGSRKLLIDRLIKKGVPVANILYINKESLEFDELKNNGTFTISGEAQNSDILGSVTDGLTNKEQQTLFGNVKLVKLVKEKDPDNQNPPYQFTIDVNYLKKGLLPEPSKSSKEK